MQIQNPFEEIAERLSRIEHCLIDIKSNNSGNKSTQSEADQLLTIKQAGEILSLSVPTLYGLVSRQAIPVSKKGKRLYFSKGELTEWIKAGRKLTVSEIESQAGNYLGNQKKRG